MVEPREEALHAAAETFGVERAYRELEPMLDEAEPDARRDRRAAARVTAFTESLLAARGAREVD